MSLLEVQEVGVRFGGVLALESLSFSLEAEQICALIGPNGAGKTTLFNVISRIYEPSQGQVRFDGHDLLAAPAHKIMDFGVARTVSGHLPCGCHLFVPRSVESRLARWKYWIA